MMLTKTELMILSYLRTNARKNISHISRQTRIPVSTIFSKLHRLENECIKKHTCLLDFQKLGLERKKIFLKSSKDDRDRLLNSLLKDKCVNTVLKIDNKFDFLVEVVFGKMAEYYEFLERLEEYDILAKEEYYVIDDLKAEEFLAIREPVFT